MHRMLLISLLPTFQWRPETALPTVPIIELILSRESSLRAAQTQQRVTQKILQGELNIFAAREEITRFLPVEYSASLSHFEWGELPPSIHHSHFVPPTLSDN